MALTSAISSLTNRYLIPKLVDNIFDSNVLMRRAKSKGWYDTIDGGTTIDQPLVYAQTTAAGWYSGSQTLSTDDNQQITQATWDWKQAYANVTITHIDELINSGSNAIINHLKSKVQLAEKTLKDIFATSLFGDGTTGIQGIKLICAATGTHGGLAKATYSWWQANVDSTTTVLTPAALQALIGDCTIDSDRPTVIVTTQDLFDDLYNAFQPQQRFADEDTLKAGFTNIIVNGIPVIVDSHCDSGYLYLLNEGYISIKAHKNENFRFDGFVKPVNQNIKTAKIYWAGAMTSSNNRMHGMFTSLT